jgi:hypothetical protein
MPFSGMERQRANFLFGNWSTTWSYWSCLRNLLVWFGLMPQTKTNQTNKLTEGSSIVAWVTLLAKIDVVNGRMVSSGR